MIDFLNKIIDFDYKFKIKIKLLREFDIKIDFMKKFEIHSFFDKLKEETNVNFKKIKKEKLFDLLIKNKVSVDKKMNFGKLLDKAFSFFVEPKLINPTFIVDYPLDLSIDAARKISLVPDLLLPNELKP